MRKTIGFILVVSATLVAAQAPAFAGWGQLPIEAGSDAAVVVTDDVMYSFVVDADGHLMLHQFAAGVGEQIRALGGTLTSPPAAIVHSSDSNAVYVFGRGGDGALWYQRVTASSSSGWLTLGGFLQGTPTAAMGLLDGVLNVFVRGGDDALWQRSIAGPGPDFTEWQSLGGILIDDPASASITNAPPTVVGVGVDGALWTGQLSDAGWTGWTSLGGQVTSYPWMVADGTEGYVFAVGLDDAMWFNRRTAGGSWAGWQSLGGQLLSGPGGYEGPSGPIVLGVGTDQAGWKQHVTPSGGAGWVSIGGTFISNLFGAQLGANGYVYGVGQDGRLYFGNV
jgi:hypothetical protein